MSNQATMRVRLTYSKMGYLRFTGHLDMQRLWERAFRRSNLPMYYSQGFSPKVRLNLASALPLGITSDCEVIDFWLAQSLSIDQIQAAISPTLPSDMTIKEIIEVSLSLPAIQTLIIESEYQVTVPPSIDFEGLKLRINEFLTKSEVLRIRRDKSYNLRPLVHELNTYVQTGFPILFMRLNAQEGATGRPDELLSQLGIDPYSCDIHRLSLIYK
ncbi:MAG: TIGR03936 family radical SAM-associated protein [Anaerolineaceae bacterium]|nr:TIGR03936 family radical SAM-associated protein [Anaerolineaceae bacterium]